MASTGVNVFRWSALGFGVFYGFWHQSSIKSADKQDAVKRDYERRSHLIDEAKAAYAKKSLPADAKTKGGQIISDPEDPKFDLEAYLKVVSAEAK